MKLVTFVAEGPARPGALAAEGKVLDIDIALHAMAIDRRFGDMIGLIEAGPAGLGLEARALAAAPGIALFPLEAVRLCAPIRVHRARATR